MADGDACGFEAKRRGFDRGEISRDIESAFGGDFLTFFGNEANIVGFEVAGETDDFLGNRHFEIQFGADVFLEQSDVAFLHVATVFAQMDGDAVRARGFANGGGVERVRFKPRPRQRAVGVFAARLVGIPRLPQRGDVVNVDSESEGHAADVSKVAGIGEVAEWKGDKVVE